MQVPKQPPKPLRFDIPGWFVRTVAGAAIGLWCAAALALMAWTLHTVHSNTVVIAGINERVSVLVRFMVPQRKQVRVHP